MFGFGTGGHYNVGSCLETSEFRLSSPRKQSCEGKKKDSSSLVILKCYFTQIWKSCHNLLTRSHKTISQWNRNNNSFSILSSSYYQHACEHIKYCKHKLNDTSVSHENNPHWFLQTLMNACHTRTNLIDSQASGKYGSALVHHIAYAIFTVYQYVYVLKCLCSTAVVYMCYFFNVFLKLKMLVVWTFNEWTKLCSNILMCVLTMNESLFGMTF